MPRLFTSHTCYLIMLFGYMPLAQAEQIKSHEITHEITQCHQQNEQRKTAAAISGDDNIYIEADNATSAKSRLIAIDGNVRFKKQQHTLNADKAQYDRSLNLLNAQGNIYYQAGDLVIRSQSLSLNLDNNSGSAIETEYQLTQQNSNGIAGKIAFSKNQVQLNQSTYSTCKETEKTWQIRADQIELHPEKNEGIARNMQLEIAGVPILYLPYISFPLQGRKTGFLAPNPRYSSKNGVDIATPYYLNLSTNTDLTFTPRFIESRGSQLGAELRHLQKNNYSKIGFENLQSDKITGQNRYFLNAAHQNKINQNTDVEIEIAHVSDTNYFRELGTELNTVNQQRLSRYLQFNTKGKSWWFTGLVQDFQMLDKLQEPYRKLPQLYLNIGEYFGPVKWQVASQYSYFSNDSSNNGSNNIQRFSFNPRLSIPIHRRAGFFIPSIQTFTRLYRSEGIANSEANNGELNHQQFTNWQFNVRTGLYFERQTRNSYQTLTPEIQYSYAPFKEQSTLPLIDSDVRNNDLSQLFAANRYVGNDRLGDQNRLTWSLANEYTLKKSNRRLYAIRFGQAIYLKNQTLTLGQTNYPEHKFKKYEFASAAEVSSQLSRAISGRASVYQHSDESRLNNTNLSLKYSNDIQKAELAYRYRDNQLEQISTTGILKISASWHLAGRWLYSLNENQTQEALLGLAYNNCCWAVRFMARQFATASNQAVDTSFGVQIELKGLTRIGSSIDKQFSDEVFGHQ